MEKTEKKFYLMLVFFILVIVICFIINWHASNLSNSYLMNAKFNRMNQENFQYYAIDRGIRANGNLGVSLGLGQEMITDVVLWSKTNDENLLNEVLELQKYMSSTIQNGQNFSKEMNDYSNISKEFGRQSIENESIVAQIDQGLNKMQLAPIFFSMTFIPLGLNEKREEKFVSRKVIISLIIFLLGFIIWIIGFAPVFNLLF